MASLYISKSWERWAPVAHIVSVILATWEAEI
jgi:hypothetical protein